MIDYPRIMVQVKIDSFEAYVQRAFSGMEPELERAANAAIDHAMKNLDLAPLAEKAVKDLVDTAFKRLQWDQQLTAILEGELRSALIRSLQP